MWMTTASQHISLKVTVKGFEKSCISSAVDETDDMLWNDTEDSGNGSGECEEDEGN